PFRDPEDQRRCTRCIGISDDRIDIYDDRKTRYVPCDDTAHVQPLEQNN
ncbi:hypothetical protein F444_21980, partial [Phytophthora nicotianae P1976]